MASSVATELTNMQNATAYNTAKRSPSNDVSDSNMFLNLMLQQLKTQDPTEPTDNTQWLAQLAQYSSLEQMTQMNSGLADCMNYVSAIYNDMAMNSEINQTLSLIGKEVTINVKGEEGKPDEEIVGKVTEANFKDGTGKVKVNGEYYPITNITVVKEMGS